MTWGPEERCEGHSELQAETRSEEEGGRQHKWRGSGEVAGRGAGRGVWERIQRGALLLALRVKKEHHPNLSHLSPLNSYRTPTLSPASGKLAASLSSGSRATSLCSPEAAKVPPGVDVVSITGPAGGRLGLHQVKSYLLLIFRERGREGEHHQLVASSMPPTGDPACNPGLCPDQERNW